MQRSEAINPALGAAAVGLALIDAGGAEAKARPIENVRIAQSPMAASTGDAYQDGRALLAAGDTAGAIAAFRAALVAAPQSIDALNGLGVAYDRIGRYDVSRSWYDTALAIDPTAVLVLNNLGYSLYLQGRYEAAIPLLQQVVDSDDAAARQTGQRLLTLIGARMRADAIEGRPPVSFAAAPSSREAVVAPRPAPATVTASTVPKSIPAAPATARPKKASAAAAPVTQVEAPQARIEITSSGEQRLVIGGPAPTPELIASLGDAAPMVMVASAWTPREEARVAARAAAQERALAERARVAGELAMALAEVRRQAQGEGLGAESRQGPAAAAASPAMPAAPPAPAAPELPDAALATASLRPDTRVQTAAALVAAAPTLDDTAGAAKPLLATAATVTSTEVADAHAAAAEVAGAEAARNVAADTADAGLDAMPPAWLLASRRAARPVEAATVDDQPISETALAFESDDVELNAFAARMRGIAPPETIMTISAEEAVERLEALLRRLRAA
jgi:tetratricopeptide (TPR) repeat protein